MNSSIRWRVMILQAVMVLVLGGVALAAYGLGTFSHNQIQDQLSEQKITFPAADSAALKALPAADASAMTQYAGQSLTDGVQAETYADHFLKVHLAEIGGGKTFAQFGATGLTPAQQATKSTLFQGETLRGLLLNAYGWWTVGSYMIYAAFGVAVAAFAVLVAFGFELVDALRERRVPVTRKAVVPATA